MRGKAKYIDTVLSSPIITASFGANLVQIGPKYDIPVIMMVANLSLKKAKLNKSGHI